MEALGGTTPSLSELETLVKDRLRDRDDVVIRVMVRPRGRPARVPGRSQEPDFIYSADELVTMRETIKALKSSGQLRHERGDGVVFGLLKKRKDGSGVEIDVEGNAELVRLAEPLKCVFHRAFDDVVGSNASYADDGWEGALEAIISCGFVGILTSGGPGDAVDNAAQLERIVERAAGRVEIIVGGGVRSSNIDELAAQLSWKDLTVWFHSSCLKTDGQGTRLDAEGAAELVRKLGALCKE